MHVVSIQTSNERGGGEYANVDLLDGLAGRGWRVKLVTNLPELADGTAVPVRQIDLGPKLSADTARSTAVRFPLYLQRVRAALAAEAAEAPIDAILLHYKKEQLMTRMLGTYAERVVWAEWGPLPFPFRTGFPQRAYALNARRVSHVICISENTRRTVIDGGVDEARSSVIPNLVDTATLDFVPEARTRYRTEWGIDADTFVVGCISRFQRKKRNDVVIDAAAHLAEGRQRTVIMLFGDGDEEAALRERAAPYGDAVRFLPTPRGYVEEVLSACDVQVFAPSPTEGAPRSVILGQLCRRPVIATHPEGADEMLPEGTGTVVDPHHDPAALASVLVAYRDDPGRREREGEAARALALDRYDPERTMDAFAAVLGGRA